MADTVLVTGGSGYIGGWCIIELIRRGYIVRATIRSLEREAAVRAALSTEVDLDGRLSFHAADLTRDEGWDEAAAGATYVLHVASPLGVPEPRNPQDLIGPARDGAVRAVRAAIKAGARRVVMTSSVAAASRPWSEPDGVSDETVWTNGDDPKSGAYPRSKVIAEKAAWAIVESEAKGAMTMATVNPALVLGPVFSKDFSDSVQVVERLLTGRVPGLPRIGFNIVDVRDVADLHIRAMTAPEAAGQRFIAAGQYATMAEIAAILRARLPDHAPNIPANRIPDLFLKAASLFDRDLKAIVPGLGRKREFTSAKAQSMLGWSPRDIHETVMDCAVSLITHEVA